MRVDDLELSVRTANVLRLAGVTEIMTFKGLTKADVMAMANAGVKTWKEIEAIQCELVGPGRTERLARLHKMLRECREEADWLGLVFVTIDGTPQLAELIKEKH